MADEGLPQYQDTQPVLNVQNVDSGASGYQAFAQALDKLSGESEQEAEKIQTDQSQAMYIHSVANIEQVKAASEMRLIEHPDQAQRISDDMQSATDQIKQLAYVNTQDRGKLNLYAETASDDVGIKATDATVKQTQLSAAFTHYANWPSQLKAYQDALTSGDEKTADNLQQAMITTLRGLVQTRSITPEQAGSAINTMQGVSDIASDHLKLASLINSGGNVNAQDYHTVTGSPLNNPAANTNAPINGNTQWLTNHYNDDKSFQGVLSDIMNGNMPNMQAFDDLQPDQRQHAILTLQGKQMANGIINSGEPLPSILKTFQELNTKGRVLNYQDQAVRNGLETYLNDLKNGNYLSVIGNTPQGGAIMQNFINKNAAIQNSPIDDNQKMQMMNQNKNDMVNAAVSYGHALHMPDDVIKPIPSTDLAQMQNGFTLNQDPSIVLSTLNQYNKQNQAYVANSLKTPEQRLIAQTLSYVGNGVKPQDQLDLISANQDGRSYSAVKPEESGLNDGKLRARIATDLKDPLNFMGNQYNFMDAQSFQGAMINSTMNLAKYLAQKNNDFGMTSWTKWVDQASAIYKNAYSPVSSTNYMINSKQLPIPMSSNELDTLAQYATRQGYQKLSQGVNPAVFDQMQSRNPLKMRISATNNIEAVDQNGSVYFSQPLTTNLVARARVDAAEQLKQQKQGALNAYEQTQKMLLHVG